MQRLAPAQPLRPRRNPFPARVVLSTLKPPARLAHPTNQTGSLLVHKMHNANRRIFHNYQLLKDLWQSYADKKFAAHA